MTVETKADAQSLQIRTCVLTYDNARFTLSPSLRPRDVDDLIDRVGPELEKIYTAMKARKQERREK